jgi:hypothetical protein
MRYCGRDFNDADLACIREIIATGLSRNRISQRVCEVLQWLKPDGGLKEMSCRVALLRMDRDGVIKLPAPRNGNGNTSPARAARRTARAEPQPPLFTPASALEDLRLEVVSSTADSLLWNEFVDRYHYLGYQPLPGAQLRYFARSREGLLGLLGFGAAAWKTAPRDRFIGWSHAQRTQRLHLVVNNARFLLLPWVASKHLASKLLGLAARCLPHDWSARYGYRPVLLETFVEKPRFAGTCYRAANWQHVGDTQGRGKLDTAHEYAVPIKSIWVLPLSASFRQSLTA